MNFDKMIVGLFARRDPVCGMKEEKGKGSFRKGNWFCSMSCAEQYEKHENKKSGQSKKHNCCGN